MDGSALALRDPDDGAFETPVRKKHCVTADVTTPECEEHVATPAPTDAQLDTLITLYMKRLQSAWIDAPLHVGPVWYLDRDLVLDCKVLPDTHLPAGFTRTTAKVQYDCGKLFGGKRYRPIAFRIPFAKSLAFRDDTFTVSHLCHNPVCANPEHHTLETLEVNKGRNGCPGGPHCHHRVKCLRPGMFCDQ